MPSLVGPVVAPGTLAAMSQPELQTDDGLILRPWYSDDVAVVVKAYADPLVQQWNLRSMNEVEAAEWIDSWKSTWIAESDAGWAVADAATGAVLGRLGLREIHLTEGQAEVTYWVLPEARGQGVAVRATVAVCRWAFRSLGLHRIELAHSVLNAASCRVATKAGFALEGTRRSALLHPDGWHDMHLHALVSSNCAAADARARSSRVTY
jgi:RimJ/RimL family protein N-acetyltransferase